VSDPTAFFAYPGVASGPASGPAPAPAPAGFLSSLPAADWALLVGVAPPRRIRVGATALGAGEADRALHVVLAGLLREAGDGAGPAAERGPGAVFGERCFLDGTAAPRPVVAVTDSVVLRLGLVEFETLAAREPGIGRFLLFDLARVLAARAAR
jgi:CRP-like cAMP-binding protein